MERMRADVNYKFVTMDAFPPVHASKEAACYDLRCPVFMNIQPKSIAMIPTGLAFEIPKGYCMQVYLRSSMMVHGLLGNTGIVDSDYRGEVFVMVYNATDQAFPIERGDRIGQVRIEPLVTTSFTAVEYLSETERGNGGFGSTGK